MIEAMINGKRQRVNVVGVGRRGALVDAGTVVYRVMYGQIRWVSPDWYNED